MTIAELRERGKRFYAKIPNDYLVVGVLIVASSLSFWLGILTGQEMKARSGGVRLEAAVAPLSAAVSSTTGAFVASKSGTKYYPVNCPGAARISAQNKIWFASPGEASARGYQPAANCEGY